MKKRILSGLVLTFATIGCAAVQAATPFETNLLVNGDAEASPGVTNTTDVAPPAGWATTAKFTAVSYDIYKTGDYHFPADYGGSAPASASRFYSGGKNFFAGGPKALTSSASQKIDISDRAREIDAGLLTVYFAGMLGGTDQNYGHPTGTMTMSVQLLDAKGNALAQQSTAGVGATSMIFHSGFVAVPAGTRSIVVTVTATCGGDNGNTYDYAYADNLFVELLNTGQTNTFLESFGPIQATASFGVAAAAMPDGGFVGYGVFGGTDVLIRYGADGKLLWTKQLTDSKNYQGGFPGRLASDPQGNIYFASIFPNSANNNPAYPYVVKFNADGVQQWFTNVKVPASEAGKQTCYSGFTDRDGYLNGGWSNIDISADGNIISLGSGVYYDPCDGITYPAIVTINAATGAPSLLLLYTTNDTDTTATGGVAALAKSKTTGNYAMLTGDPDRTAALVLVSPSGTTLAVREELGSGFAPFVLATADGGFLVANNSTLTKFTADLTVQFQKGMGRISSIVERPGGGYLLQTFIVNGQFPTNTVGLIELDSQGRLEKAFATGGPKGDGSFQGPGFQSFPRGGAVITADGGIGFVSETYSYPTSADPNNPQPAWWAGKTNGFGRIANFSGLDADAGTSISGAFPDNGMPAFHDGLPFNSPLTLGLESPARYAPSSLQTQNAPGVLVAQAVAPLPPPLAPPHGGPSATSFTVNGNYTAVTQNLAGTILHFAAQQTGRAAGLSVRVQYSTSPNPSDPANESSWTDLPNGSSGFMAYDAGSQEFVLTSTNYPQANGVSFRALTNGNGYKNSISNIVGPFNLAGGQQPLGPISLLLRPNGTTADEYFTATVPNLPNGAIVRIQSTTTPANEGSWTDLADGNSGHMNACDAAFPGQFYLFANNLPPGSGIYFRAVASNSGYLDGLSGPIGSYTLIQDTPPSVSLTPPSGAGSGNSSADPIVIQAGVLRIQASATTARKLTRLAIEVDGKEKYAVNDGSTTIDYSTSTISIGDHVLEIVAVDDLNVSARAGRGKTYLRVVPARASGKAELVAGTSQSAATAGRAFVVANDGGEWSDPNTWMDANQAHGVPGQGDFAIIGSSTVHVTTADAFVDALSIDGGSLVGGDSRHNVYVFKQMTFHSGSIKGQVNVYIDTMATLELANPQDVQLVADANKVAGTITNAGLCNVHGTGGVVGAGSFHCPGTLSWHLPLATPATAGKNPTATSRVIQIDQVPAYVLGRNSNSLITDGGASLITDNGSGVISNDGSTLVNPNGGNVVSHDGSTIISQDGSGIISQDGSGIISQDGSGIISQDGSGLINQGNGNFLRPSGGSSSARYKTATTPLVMSGGEVDLSSCSIIGDLTINGGVLSGSGIVAGNLTNNGGYISPGHSAGALLISRGFTQSVNGTIIIELGGSLPIQNDRIQIGGAANLGGNLDVKLINGYTPSASDTFNPLGYPSVNGSFSSVSANGQVSVNANGIIASIDPAKPSPGTGQPLNISTRMQVLNGDNVLIAGFIVRGTPGSTKKVMVRGLGPSLAAAGVANPLADPFLELHQPDGTVISNDNWQSGDTSQIPAGFAPPDPREAVIVADLAVGSAGYSNYTAVLRGAHGETGVGLAEAYDLSSGSGQFANISTRGFVDTGDNVMIGGFIVGGSEPAKILVRAIGPSLTAAGVQGALQSTVLEVHDSNGAVITNQGWRSTQESDIIATTIPPSNDQDSAIVETLVPGNYTAVVRGANNSTGVGLVEAYNLP